MQVEFHALMDNDTRRVIPCPIEGDLTGISRGLKSDGLWINTKLIWW